MSYIENIMKTEGVENIEQDIYTGFKPLETAFYDATLQAAYFYVSPETGSEGFLLQLNIDNGTEEGFTLEKYLFFRNEKYPAVVKGKDNAQHFSFAANTANCILKFLNCGNPTKSGTFTLWGQEKQATAFDKVNSKKVFKVLVQQQEQLGDDGKVYLKADVLEFIDSDTLETASQMYYAATDARARSTDYWNEWLEKEENLVKKIKTTQPTATPASGSSNGEKDYFAEAGGKK